MKHKSFKDQVELKIFIPAVTLLVLILMWTSTDYDSFKTFSSLLIEFVKNKFGSVINITVTLCLGVCLYFLFGKKGDYIIGGSRAKPDVSFFSYFTMSLCGVIGVGLIFWGIAEPLTHFMNPPTTLVSSGGGTPEAAVAALGISYTHWTFQLYGIYAAVGLVMSIAFYSYKLPARISSMFFPLIGERIHGGLGKSIDAFSIFAYICATGTTFSFAALQLTAGTSHFTGIEATEEISVCIILIITMIYTYSSLSGIKKGVSYSSQINFGAYILLMVFTFLVVNPQFVTELMTDSISYYFHDRLLAGGLETDAFRVADGWYQTWPVFYFVWGIATALVTSVFLAKISKGRSIRQFLIVNLVLPGIFGFLWFGIFGGSAIYLDFFHDAGIGASMSKLGTEFAAFEFFAKLPLSFITVPIFFIAASVSFTTCANSVVTAMATMTQKTSVEDAGQMTEPPKALKLSYGLLVCGISLAVLFLGGAEEIQAAAVAVGLPTAFVIILGVICLFRFLSPSFEAKYLPDDTKQ